MNTNSTWDKTRAIASFKRRYKRHLALSITSLQMELEALQKDEDFEPSAGIVSQCNELTKLNIALSTLTELEES